MSTGESCHHLCDVKLPPVAFLLLNQDDDDDDDDEYYA